MTQELDDQRISRRKALRRMGAAGALVWTVPAIQTIGMNKAFAQAGPGSAPPPGCGNARVSLDPCTTPNFNPNAGCGGQSCLTGANPGAPSACGSIQSSTVADGIDWVICLDPGCTLQSLSMAAGGACWNAAGGPVCTSPGGLSNGNWTGFDVSGNCITIHRPTGTNPAGHLVTQNISHVDLVICCSD